MVEIGSKYALSLYRIASTVVNGNLDNWKRQEIPERIYACYTCGNRIWMHAYIFEENIGGFNITYAFHNQCRNSVLQ